MKKNIKLFAVIMLLNICFYLFPETEDINLEKVRFNAIDITEYNLNINENNNYNIAYSPFLPAGGVYSAVDENTNKETIIQIGNTEVDNSPYNIYLSKYVYEFFNNVYNKKGSKIILKLKFLAWNKKDESSIYLDLQNLIVKPENSIDGIKCNGKDNYYIQLGAFNYYQNAYPLIIELIPFLNISPHFYFIKKNIFTEDNNKEMFKVIAGPYSKEKASEISDKINNSKKSKSVYYLSDKIIIGDNTGDNKK